MPLPISPDLLDVLPLTGKSPAVALWSRKTSNIFRGVLELECAGKTPEEISAVVLAAVAAEYSPGLIVPFAFGTVLRFAGGAPDSKLLEHLVDDRGRGRGTWQWLVVVDDQNKTAHGIHMWAPGYLTPVFTSLLDHFRNEGYSSLSMTKEPGRFWKRIWSVSASLVKAHQALVYIGAGFVLVVLAAQVLLAR